VSFEAKQRLFESHFAAAKVQIWQFVIFDRCMVIPTVNPEICRHYDRSFREFVQRVIGLGIPEPKQMLVFGKI